MDLKLGWLKIGIEIKVFENQNSKKIKEIQDEFRRSIRLKSETQKLGYQNFGGEIYGTAFTTFILNRKTYMTFFYIQNQGTQNVETPRGAHVPPARATGLRHG